MIATGSRAVLPPVPGLAEAAPYTNETVFDELAEKPDRMVVLGGGAIGCELGQAFARLGVAVTIVEAGARILEKEDEDAAAAVRRGMEADGVRVLAAARAQRVTREGGRVRMEIQAGNGQTETLEAEALLVGAAARPTRGPGPRGAGPWPTTARGSAGRATADLPAAHLRGRRRGRRYQFTHVADDHAHIVRTSADWPKARVDTPCCRGARSRRRGGRVGLNGARRCAQGIACDCWRQPWGRWTAGAGARGGKVREGADAGRGPHPRRDRGGGRAGDWSTSWCGHEERLWAARHRGTIHAYRPSPRRSRKAAGPPAEGAAHTAGAGKPSRGVSPAALKRCDPAPRYAPADQEAVCLLDGARAGVLGDLDLDVVFPQSVWGHACGW